jgi:hypothetical protein
MKKLFVMLAILFSMTLGFSNCASTDRTADGGEKESYASDYQGDEKESYANDYQGNEKESYSAEH